MRTPHFYFLSTLALMTALSPSLSYAVAEKDPPIEISAAGNLEWFRDDLKIIAHDDAKIAQGDMSINAHTITAFYTQNKRKTAGTRGSSMGLTKMIAQQNVDIQSGADNITGTYAIYDVSENTAIIYQTPPKDSGMAAPENARPVHLKSGTYDMFATKVTAYLDDAQSANPEIERVVAIGHVSITTPNETITGSKATYFAKNNTAEMTGNVTISRGENILHGDRATLDMNTNISRLYSDQNDGRVRGTFFPGQETTRPKTIGQKQTAPAKPKLIAPN